MMPWTTTTEDGARPLGCAPSDRRSPGPIRQEARAEYQSRFSDWYASAGVRGRPRRDVALGDGLLCFPRELAPVVEHPYLSALGPDVQREALMQHLFSYLTFTDRLEDEVVNRSARRIATGAIALPIPPAMRLDAYKIYCDEAYHSLFSADLMAQLAERACFTYDGGAGHPALTFFHERRAALDPEIRPWFELFFAVVSETLISSSLLRIPSAPDVLPAVRQLVADHAADEWRHHAFFARVCEVAWPLLRPRARRAIGPALPSFVFQFLAADRPAMLQFLSRHLGTATARTVVDESLPHDAALAHARSAARAAIRIFEHAGIFEDAETRDAFEAAGLHRRPCAASSANAPW